MKYSVASVLAVMTAPAAFAAGGPGAEPFAWLMDPVTNTAFAALVIFLLIVWRMGAFKAITSGLDSRADAIAAELEEAKSLREKATAALALAERRQQDAEKDAEQIIKQAQDDAKEMVKEAEKDLKDRLARREALAESRIARAEADAASDVRRAAADAATQAARKLLIADTSIDQFEQAAKMIEGTL